MPVMELLNILLGGLLDVSCQRQRNFKRIKGLRICIVGDISHSRVAMSNIFGLRTLGAAKSFSMRAAVIYSQKY